QPEASSPGAKDENTGAGLCRSRLVVQERLGHYIRTHRLQLVQRSAGNQQGSLGNSKRFISTFVPSILLIVLVNMDQLMVIWLQNEHTQKTRSPHLLLTSPVKRRSQRNASALPNFEIASILGAPSIRRSHISSSRKPI
ncbi:hypothetical protein, partial [Aeromonas hydrophila]|uniref:hypothetical protein n=1 Tax=Aeromonas hydrophila TaxID=644 RepID=UPI003EC86D82